MCTHCGANALVACMDVAPGTCKRCEFCGRHSTLLYTSTWDIPTPHPPETTGGAYWGGGIAGLDTTNYAPGTVLTIEQVGQMQLQGWGAPIYKKEPPRRSDGRIDFDRADL